MEIVSQKKVLAAQKSCQIRMKHFLGRWGKKFPEKRHAFCEDKIYHRGGWIVPCP